jgi:Fe-S-cluster containining protein
LSKPDCIQRSTRFHCSRRGLALAEKPNGRCVFLAGIECRLQAGKPQQCRDFPKRWNFPGFEQVCRARPRQLSLAGFRPAVARCHRFFGSTGVKGGLNPPEADRLASKCRGDQKCDYDQDYDHESRSRPGHRAKHSWIVWTSSCGV